MSTSSEVPQAPTLDPAGSPSDFIEGWSLENIGDGMPSPETLREIERALHAVDEFLVVPVAKVLKQVVEDVSAGGLRRLSEGERTVSFENVGRLIVWTDELRAQLSYLHDPIVEIALLAHEDLSDIAAGYVPDGTTLTQHSWTKQLRRFHGLDEVL